MTTKTDICNIALSNLGETIELSDVDTDQSASAKKCRRFLSVAIRGVLSDFPWTFARAVVDLSILSDQESQQYQYIYAYPQDCLEPRGIVIPNMPVGLYYRYYPYYFYGNASGLETAPPEFIRPTFVKGVAEDGKSRVIMTNYEDARLLYTKYTEEFSIWSATAIEALCWYLTSYLAMPIAQSKSLAAQAKEQYTQIVQIAQAQDERGQNAPMTPLPESVTSRLV